MSSNPLRIDVGNDLKGSILRLALVEEVLKMLSTSNDPRAPAAIEMYEKQKQTLISNIEALKSSEQKYGFLPDKSDDNNIVIGLKPASLSAKANL